MANGIHKERPRKARAITAAVSVGTPSELYTSTMTPSTTPMPMGVGATIKKSVPIEKPATRGPN